MPLASMNMVGDQFEGRTHQDRNWSYIYAVAAGEAGEKVRSKTELSVSDCDIVHRPHDRGGGVQSAN